MTPLSRKIKSNRSIRAADAHSLILMLNGIGLLQTATKSEADLLSGWQLLQFISGSYFLVGFVRASEVQSAYLFSPVLHFKCASELSIYGVSMMMASIIDWEFLIKGAESQQTSCRLYSAERKPRLCG